MTNLSDSFPWGLWIGFDVLCGVALAAGGFTITTVVYVFNLKRFQPIVRPTIITAFLGYMLVAVGLMYDLGKPWNIWHATIMWNPRSPMFEVAWCVMLYLTVLALEVSGMVFERLGWKRAAAVQHAAIVPLVIAGAIISTLHQSSLGTLLPDHAVQAAPAVVHAPAAGDVLPLGHLRRAGDDHRRVAAVPPRARAGARDAAAAVASAAPCSSCWPSTARSGCSTWRAAASCRRSGAGAARRSSSSSSWRSGLSFRWRCCPSGRCAATPGGSTGPPYWWWPESS